jgi:hypothetical protein
MDQLHIVILDVQDTNNGLEHYATVVLTKRASSPKDALQQAIDGFANYGGNLSFDDSVAYLLEPEPKEYYRD